MSTTHLPVESGAGTGSIHYMMLALTLTCLFFCGGGIPYLSLFLGKPVGQGGTVHFLGSVVHF